MIFEGLVYKSKKFWLVEAPALDAMTQGISKENALEMLKDWIHGEVNKKGLKIYITEVGGRKLLIETNLDAIVVAVMLRRQRAKQGLTIRSIARILGSKNPNSYAAYESGKREPSISKFYELLSAIDPENKIKLKVG